MRFLVIRHRDDGDAFLGVWMSAAAAWWSCSSSSCRTPGLVPAVLPVALFPPRCGFGGARLVPPTPKASGPFPDADQPLEVTDDAQAR